jgi:hypothetical protein
MGPHLHAFAVSTLVLGSVLYPLCWPPGRDSFPLSPYPMFARARSSPVLTLEHAVGVRADGSREAIAPPLFGTSEVLQARTILGRAVAGGVGPAAALCRTLADRAAETPDLAGLGEILIVTSTHDAVAYLSGADRTGREKVHVRCPVAARGGR